MPRKISSEINSKAKLDKYEEFHKQAMDATEEHQEEELSLLTSVMVVGRQYPCLSNDPPILRQIDAFVDYSSQYSLPLACKQSLRLVKRVIARTGWNGAKAIAELCEAAGRGDSHVIEWLCTVGEELGGVQASDLVNEIDFGGGTPLYMAARAGRLGILEALVDKGARLDKKDERGRTVIHMAASNGDCRVVQWLVSKGALVDEKDGDGNTPLCKAAQYGRLAMVQWLAEKVARLEEQNDSNQTALHLAASASRQSLAVVKFFVGKGLRVCETDEWGHSALYYAIGAHNFEIAEFFLDECFTEEKPQESELYDALFAAVNSDDDMFLEYLEGKFELDICHVNAQGRTALHEAAAGGALNMVYLLLDRGVDTCKSDKFGVTPVIEASRCGHVSILHSILGAKGKVDDLDLAGRSALHHAAAAGHAHVVEELLALDVDLDCCDKCGWTPLHCAAAASHLKVVEKLIKNDARTNADTLSGKSALVLAMERGCSDVVDILMDPTSTGDVSVASNKASLDDYTEYLLDSAEIQFETPVLQESASGVWLGSPIAVKVKKTWQPKNFIEELERWSKLNHPHVVKLYGVCQGDNVEEPFFVFERPAQPSLFNYLQDPEYAGTRAKLWGKLYEAAMGLEYLHDRGIVHGDISCNTIAIGENGAAKLTHFGYKYDPEYLRMCSSWTSPEELSGFPPSFKSDVYVFGLTIVQAFKTEGDPWNLFGGSRDDVIRSGKLPNKPAEMILSQWQLIQRMCCINPRDRLSASDVVRELEALSADYESTPNVCSESVMTVVMPDSWSNLGNAHIAESMISTISDFIAEIDNLSGDSNATTPTSRDVYDRLLGIFNQLKAKCGAIDENLIQRYGRILRNFHSRLKSTSSVSLAQAARFAAARQEADNSFSAHRELDFFMNAAHLSCSNRIHEWQDQWQLRRSEQQRKMLERMAVLPTLLGDVEDEREREQTLAYLRFEISNHPSSYVSQSATEFIRAKSVISSLTMKNNVNWFIPAYEVDFDKFDAFSKGAFGSVHRGRWKHAQVVVKKLIANGTSQESDMSDFSSAISFAPLLSDERHAVFLNEVEIWHKLYHPNVVQLFGACHIDQPFIVCEYAGCGQLDEYLRDHPEEIWEKLHEAALGLRYLHVKRVVHGDLKCNNILVGNDGRAKLIDFGLSTLKAEAPSIYGEPEAELDEKAAVGAIRWKAPEVLRGEKLTYESDVYSFGMCIIEVLSGKFPWDIIDEQAIKYHVLAKKIPTLPENCSEAVRELVHQMCRFIPTERVDMRAVVEALSSLH